MKICVYIDIVKFYGQHKLSVLNEYHRSKYVWNVVQEGDYHNLYSACSLYVFLDYKQ